jgi:hypothetical protein
MVVVEMAAVAMLEEETAMAGAVTAAEVMVEVARAAAVMEAAAGAVAGRTACTGTRRI